MYGLLYFKAESAKKSTFFHNNSECSVTQFYNPKLAKYNPQVICVVCWLGVSNFKLLDCSYYAVTLSFMGAFRFISAPYLIKVFIETLSIRESIMLNFSLLCYMHGDS